MTYYHPLFSYRKYKKFIQNNVNEINNVLICKINTCEMLYVDNNNTLPN